MKISVNQLRRIIKEESARILENEGMGGVDPQAVQAVLMDIKSSIDELANLYMPSVDEEMDAVYAFSQAFDDLKSELGL
jgi:hypothetical protein